MVSASESPAHDPVHMLGILQQYLPEGETRFQVRECRIANTRRRDGSRGTVEYELRLEDPDTGRIWNQQVTGISFGGDRTRRVWESMSRGDARRDGASGLVPFAYVPDLDLLLQVFPHDHRLPALARLMAGPPPELLSSLLAEFGPGEWQLLEWTAESVQYRVDMRAILRLSVQVASADRGESSERQFYAKVYRDAEVARRALQTQREVFDRASASSGHLIAARPVACPDGLRTLVTASLPGVSLSRIIRRGDGVIPAVRAAARATAEFHQLDVVAPPRPVADDVVRLREAEEFLNSARPDLAGVVSETVQAVIEGLDAAPTGLIHGDLKPDHMLIDGDRVALIDFDLTGAADPVIDVAHLVAFLGKPQERAESRREKSANAAQIFVEEYFAHVPESWRHRLPLYHAMTSVHKAVGLCRRRGADGQARVEGVLREGQALLAGDGDASVPSFKRRITRSAVRGS